jgi:hypothetical protein
MAKSYSVPGMRKHFVPYSREEFYSWWRGEGGQHDSAI